MPLSGRLCPYKLPPMSAFRLAELNDALHPYRVHYFDTLPSTNDYAIQLRRAGKLFAPAIVLTASQTAGRGRNGNRWYSTEGSLTVTFVLPVEEHLKPHQLPLVAGLAVRQAAEKLSGRPDIRLKWPNDVICQDAKLSGLLCERIDGLDLIGIGLNVNLQASDLPASTPYSPTSLSQLAGHDFDHTDVLLTLTHCLNTMLLTRHTHPFALFLQQYRQYDALIGREITIATHAENAPLIGVCEGIDSIGQLLLRTTHGLRHIISGTVRLI